MKNKVNKKISIATRAKNNHHKQKIKRVDYGRIGFFKENNGILKIVEYYCFNFIKHFPKEKDAHFFSHTYTYNFETISSLLGFYIDLYEFLDIQNSFQNLLQQEFYAIINPHLNRTIDDFKKNLKHLSRTLETTDIQVSQKLNIISEKECLRMYEAMKCLGAHCNYAAVVMAVSAVENRLHKLLQQLNKKIYNKEFAKAPLGSIISLFRKDSSFIDKKFNKFKTVLPEKHRPLMEMLNIYRIFSAHQKDEKITERTANLIVSFSFLLLIDEQLKS